MYRENAYENPYTLTKGKNRNEKPVPRYDYSNTGLPLKMQVLLEF